MVEVEPLVVVLYVKDRSIVSVVHIEPSIMHFCEADIIVCCGAVCENILCFLLHVVWFVRYEC